MIRQRDAPSDNLIPISRWRDDTHARAAGWRHSRSRSSGSIRTRRRSARTRRELRASRREAVPCRRFQHDGRGASPAACQIGSSRRPHAEPGCRLRRRDPGLQPAHHVDRHFVLSARIGRAEFAGERQRRPVVGRADVESAKVLWHDADDLARHAVDRHASADHARVACEQLDPASVAEHDRAAGRRLVVTGRERASERCLDAQHLEEVPGHEDASSPGGPRCVFRCRARWPRHRQTRWSRGATRRIPCV